MVCAHAYGSGATADTELVHEAVVEVDAGPVLGLAGRFIDSQNSIFPTSWRNELALAAADCAERKPVEALRQERLDAVPDEGRIAAADQAARDRIQPEYLAAVGRIRSVAFKLCLRKLPRHLQWCCEFLGHNRCSYTKG